MRTNDSFVSQSKEKSKANCNKGFCSVAKRKTKVARKRGTNATKRKREAIDLRTYDNFVSQSK